MSSNNFYPLTAETLEKLYKANLTAAEWRLWSYGDCTPEKKQVICLTVLGFGVIATFEEVEV